MIRIIIDEPSSLGLSLALNGFNGPNDVSDADALSLAEAILASDAVQNLAQWNGAPSLTTVTIDTINIVYPAP